MNRLVMLFLLLLTNILLAFGCGKDKSPLDAGDSNLNETGDIAFQVTYAPWKPLTAKTAAVGKIDRAAVYVYDSEDNDILDQDLEMADGRAKGSITIQSQDDLRVALVFYEGETVRYIGEDPDVDVPARGSTTAEIVEHYLGTTIATPDSAYVGKEYRLTWMKRPFAKGYEVQESADPNFTDPGSIYSGEDTTCVVEGKYEGEAELTFYYRARVYTDYGWGPWHGSGATGVAGENGTIIVDVPVPPEIPGGSGLSLLSPKGGEEWTAGSVHSIAWTASGVSRVRIEYSKDFGMTWLPVSADVAVSAGSFSWTLPGESIPGCFVRVTDTANPLTTAKNALPFSIVAQAFAPTLALITPNGGETLAAETVQSVAWTSRGVDKINIEFSRDSGSTWISLAVNIDAASGKFAWNVPDLPSTSCFLRVKASHDSQLSDASDRVFTLTATVPSITVLSPKGGEIFDGLSYIPVSWNSTGIDNVNIDYSTDNGMTWSAGPFTTTQSWQVNTKEWFTANGPLNAVLIRVRDAGESQAADTCDRPFTLGKTLRTITVTQPILGTILSGDTAYPVSWQGVGFKRDTGVGVYYYNRELYMALHGNKPMITDEIGWNSIGEGTADAGAITFRTPALHDSLRTSFRFRQSISSVYDLFSFERQSVTIAPVKFTLAVTAPNGGESWNEGSVQTIRWTSNYSDSVRIELSRDGGTSWKAIAPPVAARAGKYVWPVPNLPSGNTLVRITDPKYSDVTDRSDATFTLLGAAGNSIVTVTSPNGGEIWEVGSQQKITWTSQGVSKVNIEVSADGGKTWYPVAANVAASLGSYTSPVPKYPSENCLVRVSDASNSRVSDVCDDPIAIQTQYAPTITLTAPNGGEAWRNGLTNVIAWKSGDVNTVRIDYSIDGGTSWLTVIARANARLGYFLWDTPKTAAGTQCLIRLTDVMNTKVSGQSNAVFTMGSEGQGPAVILVSPRGGETFVSGSTQTITWQDNDVLKIRLDFSSDGGATWTSIATNLTPGTKPVSGTYFSEGSYIWTVPGIISSAVCNIRVSDQYNPANSHTLYGKTFSISNPKLTLLDIPAGDGTMGSPFETLDANPVKGQGYYTNELPVHYIILNAFRMSATEITQGQYKLLMGSNPSRNTGNDLRPVEQVTWFDAVKFCNRLSDSEGLQRSYNEVTWECDFTKSGYRLPTEAEWEYACRANDFWDPYPDTLNDFAWTTGSTQPVAQKKPNAWGLYDMLGNVLEWVNDWKGPYTRDFPDNPTGPKTGSHRVLRGGDAGHKPELCRASYRQASAPDHFEWGGFGFRVVRRP